MNSVQYEELSRFFLAQKLGIPLDDIRSVDIRNPKRPDLPEYKHQIDLYWETEDDVAQHIHIANAKWRSSDKVDQPDVMLLQKVKEKVAAHKGVMITSTDFTTGAVAAAKDEGIALHIVRPDFDTSLLATKDRQLILAKIQELASARTQPVFEHTLIHKAFDLTETAATGQAPTQSSPVSYPTATPTSYPNKMFTGYSQKGGPATGGRGSAGGPATRGGDSGFRTK
jgi:hypothetical protein